MEKKEDLETVLRDIRVFLSKGRVYEKNEDFVVVSKKEAYLLLSRFMECLESIKDEYELTQQSREQAQRDAKHKGEYIVKQANQQAEDVYAASVLYTQDALGRVQDIIEKASDQIQKTMQEFQDQMKKNCDVVRENQTELSGQLQSMKDTQKYMKLIETVNRQREEEKRREAEGEKKTIPNDAPRYAKPEIKINRAYFEAHNIPLDEKQPEREEEEPLPEIQLEEPVIQVNLDSEYFKWKNSQQEEKTEKKPEQPKKQPQDRFQMDLYEEETDNEPKEKKGRFFSFGKK